MPFVTTIGYHDGNLEVEVIVDQFAQTEEQAEELNSNPDYNVAILYADKIAVGPKDSPVLISRHEEQMYQFRICRRRDALVVSNPEDFDSVSWDEGIAFFNEHYKGFTLPFRLEAYYYSIQEGPVVVT